MKWILIVVLALGVAACNNGSISGGVGGGSIGIGGQIGISGGIGF
ncbi:hypothetical protein [Testudinibacter sp. TR-2022]|nr:hypothetical protein [Testudinibacter sp. TR-2022]